MKRITLLAVENCLSSSITNCIDAFTIANRWHQALTGAEVNAFETKVVTINGKPVTCSDCVQIHPQLSIEDTITPEYLIIPALLPVRKARALKDPLILEYIHHQYSIGTTVAAVCTGTFLLAETGLLNGRSATTNWQFEKMFRYRYPQVNLEIDKILTEEDKLICSGAASAIMHLILRIIQREGSTRLSSVCAKALLIDPNNESQAPYTIALLPKKHNDKAVLKAQQYMREHLAESVSIDSVAEHVGISSRHFKRRFKRATGESPLNFLQKLRIQTAKDQLENTLDSIEEITRRVGYEDSSTFRRLFKRHTSVSPRKYRGKFSQLKSD